MKNTTWLIGYGEKAGKPAGDLKPGDVLMWNYGVTSTVEEIAKETKAFVWIKERLDGKIYERKLKKSRIVATA